MLCGLDFGPSFRENVRPLFIDVLTRRYLLRAVAVLRMIQTPGDLNDAIDTISLKPMEDFYVDLPASFADFSYVKHPEQLNKMFSRQEREIHDFLEGFDAQWQQASQDRFPSNDDDDLHNFATSVINKDTEKTGAYMRKHFKAFCHLGKDLYTEASAIDATARTAT